MSTTNPTTETDAPATTLGTLCKNDAGRTLHIETPCWETPLETHIRTLQIQNGDNLVLEVTAHTNDYRVITRRLSDGTYTDPALETYTGDKDRGGEWSYVAPVTNITLP